MAKKRIVNTVFWDDEYIHNLNALEKLLFIYLLTNPCTTICGIYQIPLDRIILDTAIEKKKVQNILQKFQTDNKILYYHGWMAIKNFIKHQNEQSPQVKIGIDREIKNAPVELQKWILEGTSTLSHLDFDFNLDFNPDLNPNPDVASPEREVFNAWNTCTNLTHHKSIEPHHAAIKTALKHHPIKDIINAINKYNRIKVLPGTLFSYSWILKDFLKRGLDRFTGDRPDEEYISNQHKEKQSKPKPQSMKEMYG